MRVALKNLAGNVSGNIAILFALSLTFMVCAVGGALDYMNGANARNSMQIAIDNAVLAAASLKDKSPSAGEAMVRKVFANNIDGKGLKDTKVDVTRDGLNVTARATGSVQTVFMGIFGVNSIDIEVKADAIGGDSAIEVALVLDVTGSMRKEMSALRDSASKLEDIIFTQTLGDVKMAVVPFAAAVNPGRTALPDTMLDLAANSAQHGRVVEGHWISSSPYLTASELAMIPGCNSGAPTIVPPPGTGGTSDKGASLLLEFLKETIGARSAHAQAVQYPTDYPLTGTWSRLGRLIPTGFGYNVYCYNPSAAYEYLANPGKINIFTLYQRLPQVKWKGCVEARSEPYDVTDDAPNQKNANTLWWPYFWFDDNTSGTTALNNWVNNYYNVPYGFFDKANAPAGVTKPLGSTGDTALFKYNSSAALSIDEVAPDTRGPNKGCPDEILPLTSDRTAIKKKIGSLIDWDGGGTIISEGLAWGWRVLSPEPPFTEGQPANLKVRKTIVLMSDGVNELSAGNNTWYSAYTAYGGLRWGRLPQPWTFADVTTYLNSRTLMACENAKNKGIEIYTVLFKETSSAARTLMEKCATDNQHAFRAASNSDLVRAFEDIARNVSKVRLTR